MDDKKFLHQRRDIKTIIESVANKIKVLPKLVEKDYWIMHALWGLQNNGFNFELKRGTSLSKGYKIIDRFSEDIDIQIYPPEGIELKTGKNHDKPNHIKARKEYFDNLAENIIIDGFIEVQRDHDFDDDKRRGAGIRLLYNSLFEPLAGLKEGIILEVGFDDTTPNEKCNITSWVYENALKTRMKIKNNLAINIPCYLPSYTFVEKLQTVSTKYRKQQASGSMPTNFLRHYYDVYKLLEVESVKEFIGTDKYSSHKVARFRSGDEKDLTKNEAFLLSNSTIYELYKNEFKKTTGLYYKGQPSFDEIISRIQNTIKIL